MFESLAWFLASLQGSLIPVYYLPILEEGVLLTCTGLVLAFKFRGAVTAGLIILFLVAVGALLPIIFPIISPFLSHLLGG